jgi:hypothetical protein
MVELLVLPPIIEAEDISRGADMRSGLLWLIGIPIPIILIIALFSGHL